MEAQADKRTQGRSPMTADWHQELHQGLDEMTAGRRAFIGKAFRLLPKLDDPRILDVGCGRGGPTLELARLSGGQLVGIDIDRRSLRDLLARAAEHGLSGQVQVQACSMSEMDFADASFDVVWAEASIHIMGFGNGLRTWRRFLKADGFLVIHEMAWLRPDPPAKIAARWRSIFPGIRTVAEYTAEIHRHGYRLWDDFALPPDFWWGNYYALLQQRIRILRDKYRDDDAVLDALDMQQQDVDLYKQHCAWFGSVYLLLQRQSGAG
jgi:SAM-dependent methyltransferase